MQSNPQKNRVDDSDFDVIDTASAQSFPASDAPAWATGRVYPAAEPGGTAGRATEERAEDVNVHDGPKKKVPDA